MKRLGATLPILIVILIFVLGSVFTVRDLIKFKTVQGEVIYLSDPARVKDQGWKLVCLRIRDEQKRNYDVAGWWKVETKIKLREGQIVEVTFARFETIYHEYASSDRKRPDGSWEAIFGTIKVQKDGTIVGESEYVEFKGLVSYHVLKDVPCQNSKTAK